LIIGGRGFAPPTFHSKTNMNSFLKQLLAVGGLALLCLAALIVISRPERPQPVAKAEPTTTKPEPALDRTDEYDYDAPKPGSYDLPVLQDASNGTVVAPDGKPVELHKLLDGRIAILSFIYTRCSDPRACLRASSVLSQLQQLSRQDKLVANKLQLITLSFDPGYDTPEVMERYGRVFSRGDGGADWLFLTTRNQKELQPLLEAYGQRVDKRTKPSALGPYQHTLRVYLIDSQKRIRNIYSYGLLDPRLVMADVKTLLVEQNQITQN
jgi:cytochrome oxidase Cu insertion factor (SCO1/SenC/PrrC family)